MSKHFEHFQTQTSSGLQLLCMCEQTIRMFRAGKMDFKVEGSWNTEKYCRPPWLTDNKNF